jgi:hypothetical protein
MSKILTSAAFVLIASFAVATTTPASAFGPKDFKNGHGGGGGGGHGGGGFQDKDLGWKPGNGGGQDKGGNGKKWHKGHGHGFGITLNFAPAAQAAPAYNTGWAYHVNWCQDRYQTYNPSNNLYMSKKGPRECISPYL